MPSDAVRRFHLYGTTMYQRAIDLPLWADIFEECDHVSQHTPTTIWLVTTARHPMLGTVVAIQDEHADVMLFTQNPPGARDEHHPANRDTLPLAAA